MNNRASSFPFELSEGDLTFEEQHGDTTEDHKDNGSARPDGCKVIRKQERSQEDTNDDEYTRQ